jgi:dihydrodipicolinate synthase/N-acetylneuraminate lyase
METKSRADAMTPCPAHSVRPNGTLGRLIAAAVVDQEFRDLLLINSAAALAAGCNGESFHLTPEERELVVSIRASSLVDFAAQLIRNGHYGTTHES